LNISINDRISLFCECFGDTREEVRKFFSCSDIINVSICKEDRLVSMASLVPILALENNISGYYIYGVCVAPDMRGKGLFREIMQLSEYEAKSKGASFVCLIPADASLDETYKKMGYTIPVSQKNERIGAKGIALISNEFREFAKSDSIEMAQQKGLLKVLNENEFNPCNEKLCFLDDMGDV